MIEILPRLGKYKYDTWRIIPVKCYNDNFVRLRSCIRNINILLARKFRSLHKFHKERKRSPRVCFECGDTSHFIVDCP
jgi:hypothetical protein